MKIDTFLPFKIIEEEEEKSRSISKRIGSDSTLEFQTNEPTHLPMETFSYLEQLPFKNKFIINKGHKSDFLPKVFSFDKNSSPFDSIKSHKSRETVILPKDKLIINEAPNTFPNPNIFRASPRQENSFLKINSKVQSVCDYNSSITIRDSATIEEKLEFFKEKFENRACQCPDILIVDDHFFNIKVFETIALNLPFKLVIDAADSGDLAIQKIKSFYENSQCPLELKCYAYKCIFMDYDMPKKTGVETMIEISEFFKEKNYSSCVVPWTAFDDKLSRNECKNAGMVDFLNKPFDLNQLMGILIKRVLPPLS